MSVGACVLVHKLTMYVQVTQRPADDVGSAGASYRWLGGSRCGSQELSPAHSTSSVSAPSLLSLSATPEFSFLCCPAPQCMKWCLTHLGCAFSPQLN